MMRSRVSLEQVTDRIGDGLHGTPKYSETGDIPFINGNNLKSGRIAVNGKTKYVCEDEYDKHAKSLNERTVLLSINGTIGNVAQYRGEKVVLGKSACYLKCNEDIDPRFLVYLLKDRVFQSHIRQTATGTTIKNVSLALIREYEFDLPLKSDQQAIAHILGTLDDKIELNQKMNQTLEDIAKAIFKSWFVDFDPVRAKAEGRPTGLPPEISDLFPDQLVDSGIGEIPKGWILSAFDDLVEEYIDNRGKTPPTENSGIPLVEIKHIYPNSLFPNLNTDKYVSKDTLESWFRKYVKKYDVLISTVGTIGLTSIVFNEEFAIAQNILGFRFKNESLSTFMFCMIKSMYFQNQINARLIETVQKSIKRKDLNTIPVLVPDENLIGRFFNIVNPLIERSYNNSCQNEVLSELRDTLLPKLISGELRIPDAEKFLEEAGI